MCFYMEKSTSVDKPKLARRVTSGIDQIINSQDLWNCRLFQNRMQFPVAKHRKIDWILCLEIFWMDVLYLNAPKTSNQLTKSWRMKIYWRRSALGQLFTLIFIYLL